MAEGKVKEPTLREKVIQDVGEVLAEGFGLAEIPVTKQGFLFQFEDKHFVVTIIQKKEMVPQAEIKSLFVLEEAEEADEYEPAEAEFVAEEAM